MEDPVVAKLREIRDRDRLSTGRMARKIGVDQSTLYLVFQGKRGVGRKLLDLAIAAYPEIADSHVRPLTIRHDDVADMLEVAAS
jgi:DNA-binding XRE family transcriptional regulator